MFEKIYGIVITFLFLLVNPYKNLFVHTECEVHLFNNLHALKLLRQYGYTNAYKLMKTYWRPIQKGSVWADQNFKSTGHFYNPKQNKGMFGQSNALKLAEGYYKKALYFYKNNQPEKAFFYFGACIHIIQDLTVPQHVRIRLLNHHRSYENFVKYTYDLVKEYRTSSPPIILPDVRTYLDYNARVAIKIDQAYYKTTPLKIRFFKQTLSSLPLAQCTTAGCMITFFIDTLKHSPTT